MARPKSDFVIVKRNDRLARTSGGVPEILGMSDRIVVIHEGKMAGQFERHEATQEKILNCAAGN